MLVYREGAGEWSRDACLGGAKQVEWGDQLKRRGATSRLDGVATEVNSSLVNKYFETEDSLRG